MKNDTTIYFIIILLVLLSSGCSALDVPKLSAIPEVPKKFQLHPKSHSLIGECPKIKGVFYRTPLSFTLKNNTELRQTDEGTKFSFMSLFGVGKAEKVELKRNILVEKDMIFIDQKRADILQIVTQHLRSGELLRDQLNSTNGDFTCINGTIAFRVIEFKGGAEGTIINYKSYRELFKLNNGNLLFYEQLAYPKKAEHYYFEFVKGVGDN